MNNALIPTKIHSPKPYLISIEWADGFGAVIALAKFREECPCAVCKGEEVMGTVYSFGLTMFKPGMNELDGINSVGNYGIQVAWKDGHNTGIYTWEILRNIAELHALSEEQMRELERQSPTNNHN